MARRSLQDAGLAEEAVQETFLRAWRSSHRYDPELSSLRTWLFSIARNVVVDLARARRSRRLPEALVEMGTAASEEPLDVVLASWEIEEGLRRISADHRRAIVEVYYRGRSSAEIAAQIGVPEGTVRSRLYYGLKALRLALEERGWVR